MKVLTYRDAEFEGFAKKLKRRAIPGDEVREAVAAIVSEVAAKGDAALCGFAEKFDRVKLEPAGLFVGEEEIEAAKRAVSRETKRAVAATLKNITEFAKRSLRKDWSYRNAEGARVGERFVPFDRVGVYVPGGKAPLVSTALMTAGFAKAAKVPEILGATPCGPDGEVNAALLYALHAAGAREILKIGGAQAVAAMALGTESVRPVDRIFGPGNRYVVEAKRQLVGAVSIDLLPGPSEILVLSDRTGNPEFIAADLLAQAEHGGDSEIGFLSDSKALISAVLKEVERQLPLLSRAGYVREVLDRAAFALHVKRFEDGVGLVNDYAPEHLTLICAEEKKWLGRVRTAGAIYVGNLSAVAVGDFLAGPSHTLPTGGAGRSFSGLRADQFQRRTSIVKMDAAAVRKSLPVVEEFARIEGLDAHGRSVAVRAKP